MFLLPETFEVAILIGACFLVNYVTADSKTNWAEGMTMVAFYVMIVRFLSDVLWVYLLTKLHNVSGALLLVLPRPRRSPLTVSLWTGVRYSCASFESYIARINQVHDV